MSWTTPVDSIEQIQASVPAEADESQVRDSRRERLSIFWEPSDGGLWSSPNCSTLRKPVKRPQDETDAGTIWNIYRSPRKTRWISSLQPFLAFWPAYADWSGIFAPLNMIPGRVPTQMYRTGPGYHLSLDRIEAWQTLEGRLVRLGTGLMNRHSNLKDRFESDISVSTLPYECGYANIFRHERDAATAAISSRIAFISLSSFVSFAIALDLAVNPWLSGTTPSWFAFAEKELQMDPAWLNGLNESFVCCFTPGFRPGAYVYYNWPLLRATFPAFLAGNVPLYICWGYKPGFITPNSLMWRYRPCRAEARRAISEKDAMDHVTSAQLDAKGRPSSDAWSNMHVVQAPVNHPPPRGVSHNPPSPQPFPEDFVLRDSPESPPPDRQGEVDDQDSEHMGPREHLVWLDNRRIEAMQSEGPDAVRQREEQEKTAEKARLDTGSDEPCIGETMYIWVGRGANEFLQRGIPRDQWKETWALYNPDERHYSVVYNEWNLCKNNDPVVPEDERPRTVDETLVINANVYDPEHPWWDESESESEDEGRKRKKKTKKSTVREPHKRPDTSVDNRLAKHIQLQNQPFTPNAVAVSIPINSLATRDAVTLLREVYQFVVPQPYTIHLRMATVLFPPLEAGQVVEAEGPSKKTILRRLGMDATNAPPQVQRCIVDFYNFLVSPTTPQPFSPLWLYGSAFRNHIVDHGYFHYNRIAESFHIIGTRQQPLVKQFYFVVLVDPRAVVEVFSHQMKYLNDIVRYLVDHGIPFATAKPVWRPRHKPGHRDEMKREYYREERTNFFTLVHYDQYVKKRDKILLTSMGRAALTRGGLVWRLAKDVVERRDVTRGPTSLASRVALSVGELQGYTLVDDQLSEVELDIICGTYEVYNDSRHQTSHMSWFPKAAIWEASGHNHGYWTADNEVWYQQRLREIQNGGQPKSSTQWRRIMMKDIRVGRTHDFIRRVSSLSDEFLRGEMLLE